MVGDLRNLIVLITVAILFSAACRPESVVRYRAAEEPPVSEMPAGPVRSLLESALSQTKITTGYTQEYYVIPYPNGDVPAETGACTDVVIRAFRAAGVDLQKDLHEDISKSFDAYPRKWGLAKPDTNIDHRRVPNLQTFFDRRGKSLPVTKKVTDYHPGDVVSWT